MVKVLKRSKRASAEQLYRTCKQAGTCPPDVIPKIEQTTIADQILKYGSSAVFFGGLGIGTGSGSGGASGYVPIRGGAGSSVSVGPRIPIRPPQIVEDVITIGPGDSSVIGVDVSPPQQPVEVEIIAEGGGVPTVPSAADTFNVVTSPDTSVVSTQPPTVSTPATGASSGGRAVQSSQHFNNPVFEASTPRAPSIGETSFSPHTTVVAGSSNVGVEEIPLAEFPQSSTPLHAVTRGATAFTKYNVYTRQVPIESPSLYTDPTNLIAIRNPLFDIDPYNASATLEADPDNIPAPNDSRFLDIFKLHRPAMSRTKAGKIRFSRIGFSKGTVTTRAGTNIGGRVHFYHDFSTIVRSSASESIELQPLTVGSDTASSSLLSVESVGESTFSSDPIVSFYDPEADLNLQLEVTSDSEQSFVRPSGGSTYVDNSTSVHPVPNSKTASHTFVPSVPGFPYTPIITGVFVSFDFWLHPSQLLKRKRSPFYLADGIVAA
ncbi:L2 [Ailuropoda melanoleuca papillomavirus 2]|uniref:Minor capsid protein L2 n=1 Tax=Ailuropoda melanoleuca papillomavirus 2 TaxID=2016455 RepID=A0A220IGF4_9PAPI|nr:L2 [Ailuropoda melanoleuca papillomavirus 2]ASH99060.1 L2 [Ailuropoda melanoleuca papillomavirus 2]